MRSAWKKSRYTKITFDLQFKNIWKKSCVRQMHGIL